MIIAAPLLYIKPCFNRCIHPSFYCNTLLHDPEQFNSTIDFFAEEEKVYVRLRPSFQWDKFQPKVACDEPIDILMNKPLQ